MAGKGSVVWNDNFLHTQYSLLSVGDNFRDDIGFIKRTGIRKHFVDFGVRPRPEWWRKFGIRELHPHTRYNIYTDQSNAKVSHTNHVAMAWFFERGGYLELQWNPRFERIVDAVQGPAGPVVRARQLRLERVRAGARDQPQPEGVGLGADHDRRVLDRDAAVDEGRA